MSVVYSFDRDDWHNPMDTAEEALQYLNDPKMNICFVGKTSKIDGSDFLCIDSLLENTRDFALDTHGDLAEQFLEDYTRKQVDELSEILYYHFDEWLKKHKMEPKFYHVDEIQEITKDELKNLS